MDNSLSETHKLYCSSTVPDAGVGHLIRQPHGHPGEVYRCPAHAGTDCELCGGTGYRSVCDITACHEHGCQFGACGRTQEDFLSRQGKADLPFPR